MLNTYQCKTPLTESIIKMYNSHSVMEITSFMDDPRYTKPKYKEMLYIDTILAIGDKCTATDLCKLYCTSKALVSQTLSAMERKGYIYRVRDEEDHRRYYIRITPDQQKVVLKEAEILDDCIVNAVNKHTKEEVEAAAKLIDDIAESMRARSPAKLY